MNIKLIIIIGLIIAVIISSLFAVSYWVLFVTVEYCIGVFLDVLEINEIPLDEINESNIPQILGHDMEEVMICVFLIDSFRVERI